VPPPAEHVFVPLDKPRTHFSLSSSCEERAGVRSRIPRTAKSMRRSKKLLTPHPDPLPVEGRGNGKPAPRKLSERDRSLGCSSLDSTSFWNCSKLSIPFGPAARRDVARSVLRHAKTELQSPAA